MKGSVVRGGAFLILAGMLLLFGLPVGAAPRQSVPDVSWPNCQVTQLPHGLPSVIGVTGGLDFHPNPCLLAQTRLTGNDYALYINTGYPGAQAPRRFPSYPRACDAANTLCLAYNYGYNAARYSITYASSELAHSNVWWLDVETSNSWTDNVLQNRASLQGMIDALRHYTYRPVIGFYSYPGQWVQITGDWRPAYPAWVATGTSAYGAAMRACSQPSFTGEPVWLSQYTTRLDHNLVCSDNYAKAFQL